MFSISGDELKCRFFLLLFPIVLLSGCSEKNIEAGTDAEFVGHQKCIECHEFEYETWKGSHHDMAMDTAIDKNVLADFNNSIFVYYGDTTKFFRRYDRYYVQTLGQDSLKHEYEIIYTFGWTPLQQYLVEFPNGKYQVLPFCWDTRPKEEGGQRWFHIYPDENILPGDILFWTGPQQNWNFVCAECHSTDLKKNYDFKSNSYQTSWKEIDVSCEACHGPCSIHMDWAELQKNDDEDTLLYSNMGLLIDFLDDPDDDWALHVDKNLVFRKSRKKDQVLIDMCARCHSRRQNIWNNYKFGYALTQTHKTSTMNSVLYYPDGQIKDEVYVWGSFLQSKMYSMGVRCTDCHDPHDMGITQNQNLTCNVCHLPQKYDTKEHHFHKLDSTGASCTDCHMPETNFMVIDPRRDHGIRIPRPDLTLKIGSPNACNKCHFDKSVKWSVEAFEKWYGTKYKDSIHFGEVFASASSRNPENNKALIDILQNNEYPDFIRASSLNYLVYYPTSETHNAIQKSLYDKSFIVRMAALDLLSELSLQGFPANVFDLLNDDIRAVRLETFDYLKNFPASAFQKIQLERLDNSYGEYYTSQEYDFEHSSSHLNIGFYHFNRQNYKEAIKSFNNSLKIEPGNIPAKLNIADVYRSMGQDHKGKKILEEALKEQPEHSGLHHAYGLLLIRMKEIDKGIEHLGKAVEIDNNVRYSYVYAISLNSVGRIDQAVSILEKSHLSDPYNTDVLYALATINRDRQNKSEALKFTEKLVDLQPTNQIYQQLLNSLK